MILSILAYAIDSSLKFPARWLRYENSWKHDQLNWLLNSSFVAADSLAWTTGDPDRS